MGVNESDKEKENWLNSHYSKLEFLRWVIAGILELIVSLAILFVWLFILYKDIS